MSDAIAVQRDSLTTVHWIAVGGVFAAVCMLATGGIFVKYSTLEPIATGMWRVILAIPLAWGWLISERRTNRNTLAHARISWHHAILLLTAGMSLGIDLTLWNISFSYTTVANANLLANMVPFIIIPVAWIFFKEYISPKFLLGAALTITGMVILLGRKFSTGIETLFGDGLAFATAFFYATYLLMVRKLRERYSTPYIMYMSGFGCLVVLIPLALLLEERILPETLGDLWPLLGLAAIAHVGGQGLLALSLKYLSASLSSVLVLLQPVVAAVYAWHLFEETLSINELSGISVCIVGLYVATRSRQGGR